MNGTCCAQGANALASSQKGDVPRITEADMRHASHYADKLRKLGQAFMTAPGLDASLRGFEQDWEQIQLGFGRVGPASAVARQAARVCVDFVNHPGLWLLDIYRPIIERLGWLELARDAARLLDDLTSLVLIVNNLGITNLNLGRPREALRLHKEALAIAPRIPHIVEQAHAISSIGICYKHLGQYRQALRWHQKILLLGHARKLAHLRLNAIGNIGITLLLLRKPDAACEYLKTARMMARRLDRRREEGYALGYLGRAYRQMGRAKQAADCHSKHLAISRGMAISPDMSDVRGEADALGGLGNALLDLCRISEALSYHREQLQIAETTNQPEVVAEALGNLSISLLRMSMAADAAARRDQAVAIYKQVGNPAALADLNEQWSMACEVVGKNDQAIVHAESAIEILRQQHLPGIRTLRQRIARLRRTKAVPKRSGR